MTEAGDLDGDGVGDVWISSYQWDQGPLADAGRLWAVSGRTRALLYTIASPEPQGSTSPFAGFGWAISSLGDIDGDRVNDLVVGSVRHNATAAGAPCTPPAADCNAEQGKAWAFSGAVGKSKTPLYELNNPVPQAFGGFGGVSTAGDIVKADGTPGHDGITEVLVGAFLNDVPAGCGNAAPIVGPCRKDEGQVFVFNGALSVAPAQRLVRTLSVPPEDRYVNASGICESSQQPPPGHPTTQHCGALGEVAQGTGDVNGDGFEDQSGTAWTTGVTNPGRQACLGVYPEVSTDDCNERQGRIYIYSGKDGSLLRKLDDPIPQTGALFGLQKVNAGAPGDIDGDGFADLYGNGFMQRSPSQGGAAPLPFAGQAWTFSGRTGQVLHQYANPTPEAFGAFGYSMTKTDYNRDGKPDLFVGSFSGSHVFDDPTGALQKSFDVPPADRAGQPPGNVNFGYSIAAPGDLNGDGEPDYVSAAPGLDVGPNRDDGPAYFFLSKVPPPAPAPGQPPGSTPGPSTPPVTPPRAPVLRVPAQLQVERVQVRGGRLKIVLRLSSQASGSVRLRFQGAGRTLSFSVRIARGTVRVTRKLSGAQSRLRTGTLSVSYAGSSGVRPDSLRLRAASRLPRLVARVARIISGQLKVSGTITPSARGVVRVRLGYAAGGDSVKFLTYSAPITRGRWRLTQKLPAAAKEGGELSILYPGSSRGPIAGAQLARRVTPGP